MNPAPLPRREADGDLTVEVRLPAEIVADVERAAGGGAVLFVREGAAEAVVRLTRIVRW